MLSYKPRQLSRDIIKLMTGLSGLENRNKDFLHLTVNENQLSKTAHSFLSFKIAERYYFGAGKDGVVDFGAYTFLGMPGLENLVDDASLALSGMTGAKVINLSSFSGLHAMQMVIMSTTEPGDVVMSLPFENGGHGATKGIIESLGRKHVFAAFNQKTLNFNVSETAKLFKSSKAKALYIDVSVHINPINIRELRGALGKKALIIFDASHSLGLILGGSFQSPFKEGADVVCGNTHKTFGGPQRGIILFKDKGLGEKADWAIKTTYVSSVHPAELIALCISILEYEKYGKRYSKQVIRNSQALTKAFEKLGYEVRRKPDGSLTENEQVHLFLDKHGKRLDLYKNLVNNNISTNFMQILGGRTFARIGTQEITRRGMCEGDMSTVAFLVTQALKGIDVKDKVLRFNKKFPNIYFSFDQDE